MRDPKQRKNVELGLSRPSRLTRAICPQAAWPKSRISHGCGSGPSGNFGLVVELSRNAMREPERLPRTISMLGWWTVTLRWELWMIDENNCWPKTKRRLFAPRERTHFDISLSIRRKTFWLVLKIILSLRVWCGWSVNWSRRLYSTLNYQTTLRKQSVRRADKLFNWTGQTL